LSLLLDPKGLRRSFAPTTELYLLRLHNNRAESCLASLHDPLPVFDLRICGFIARPGDRGTGRRDTGSEDTAQDRSRPVTGGKRQIGTGGGINGSIVRLDAAVIGGAVGQTTERDRVGRHKISVESGR